MSKHSPEPWSWKSCHSEDTESWKIFGSNDDHKQELIDANCNTILAAKLNDIYETQFLLVGADDARRIIACVNACAGIETDKLEEAAKDRPPDGYWLAPVPTVKNQRFAMGMPVMRARRCR